MNALCMDPDSSYPYNLTWKRSQKLYTADSRNKTDNEMCFLSLATLSSYFCSPLFLQFRFCRPRDQKSLFCTFPSNVLKCLPCYNWTGKEAKLMTHPGGQSSRKWDLPTLLAHCTNGGRLDICKGAIFTGPVAWLINVSTRATWPRCWALASTSSCPTATTSQALRACHSAACTMGIHIW
jgi:hypothetical protein